jgi:hypothetical protein
MAEVNPSPARMGCFAKGCLITSLVGFTLLVLLLGGIWFLYAKAVDTYTSPQPAAITTQTPTEAQFRSANEMLERLRSAMAAGKSETIEFTATDLNALLAHHPSFADPHREIRITMANSIMTLEMSVPFEKSRLPRLRGRWFNCTARFGLDYAGGQFSITPKSVVANEHPAPQLIYSESFVSSFNRSFTRGFMNSVRQSAEGGAFWAKIRSMTVRDDRLVITTEPADASLVRRERPAAHRLRA